MTPILLYDKYDFLKGHKRLASDYSEARVVSIEDGSNGNQLDLALRLIKPIPPYEIAILEELISENLGVGMVNISVSFANRPAAFRQTSDTHQAQQQQQPVNDAKSSPSKKNSPSSSGGPRAGTNPTVVKPILGRVTKTAPKQIQNITLDDGRVTVRGFVCGQRSRFIEKSGSYLINFDITDYTGTINISSFSREKSSKKVMESIKLGMYLTVSGMLSINRYDQELTLTPQNIFPSEYIERTDAADADKKRVELHLHTKMSATDALTDVGDVIMRAAKWGHPAIAITDHGVVHSFPEAAGAAKKAAKKGNPIKVIYGMEGYYRTDTEATKAKGQNYHIILLVKNKTGLKNLYKLVSDSHIKYFYKRPLIYKSILEEHREGLIIGSACESGELFRAITSGKSDSELQAIAKFYDYLEIQPLCNNMFMLGNDNSSAGSVADLRKFNKKVVELGRVLGIPVVATTDAHFLEPEHEVFRKIILTGKGYENSLQDLPLYFRTTDEMLREFSYLGEETAFEVVITNPVKIADMCEAISPLPPDKQFFPPTLDGSAEELKELVFGKIPGLYGENPPKLITDRVEAEMKDILGLHYDVIYMTAQKLVAFVQNMGGRVGSRGSVGSSFVAHLAGITEVNPLPAHYRCPVCKNIEFPGGSTLPCGADLPDKSCPACGAAYIKDGFNIPFETFLGFNGEKIPDIDLNISGDHQPNAQKFIHELFGDDYVYRAGTIGTIKDKNAYRMVREYLEKTGLRATKAEENRLIAGCLGVKQTSGQHPGGLIVIPKGMEVTDFCPVQHPADDEEKGIITTHFDYHKMEDHLIKLDMLGHDDPKMLVMLERMTGVNADDIPLDDPDTMSIFSSPEVLGLPDDDDIIGETGAIGIPEFGTPFVRQMLCDTRPRDFDTLVRLSGYSHGTNVWLGNAKDLIASGKVTVAETISGRDDIMLYLISKGMEAKVAFKISESVRKGRHVPDGLDEQMSKHGVPQWYIDSCNKIGYLFPRAHAVAYVMMAFRIAWFKVHRPLEYYSAHFYRRSQNGAFDVGSMTCGIDKIKAKINEIKALKTSTKKEEELLVSLEACYEFYMRGFDFAPIDLYESAAEEFLIVKQAGSDAAGSDAATGNNATGKGTLRPPFVAIGGLGTTAALSLAKHREGREFISIEELSSACPGVNKKHIEELTRLGALRDIPETSQMSLF